jgi:SWIM zinc finger
MELPTLKYVLSDLLDDLESHPLDSIADSTANISLEIDSAPPIVENTLLAFHKIFPQLLLQSLNLLDNALVTKYILTPDPQNESTVSPPIFYVRSSRATGLGARTVYEVRPEAWHCTCPAFTFSAFSSRSQFDPSVGQEDDEVEGSKWGGAMRGSQTIVCKHLLAVLIGDRIRVVPTKYVDLHTLANYAFSEA